MITFDPIEEFIDSKKQTFKSKIEFFVSGAKIFENDLNSWKFSRALCIFLAIQFAISIKLLDFYSGSKKI